MPLELSKKALELLYAIEELPASIQQTKVSTLACELRDEIEFKERREIAVQKGWTLPSENNPFPKTTWSFYWQQCEWCEADPKLGRPIPPHR